MPVMRSAVLCGSHSGDLVPDLHGSVPESGDIEILDTHVSYYDGQPDLFMGSYSCDQGYTAKDKTHFPEQLSISQSETMYKHQIISGMHARTGLIMQHEHKYTSLRQSSSHSGNHTIMQHYIKLLH